MMMIFLIINNKFHLSLIKSNFMSLVRQSLRINCISSIIMKFHQSTGNFVGSVQMVDKYNHPMIIILVVHILESLFLHSSLILF